MSISERVTKTIDCLASPETRCWTGFNGEFSKQAIEKEWGIESKFTSTSGMSKKPITVFVDSSNANVQISYFEEAPLKIQVESPPLNSKKILDTFGKPDTTLTYYSQIMEVPKGEKVYLTKGVALKVEGEQVEEVILFEPCSKDKYLEYIHIQGMTYREFE